MAEASSAISLTATTPPLLLAMVEEARPLLTSQLLLGPAVATGLLIALITVVCAAGLGLRPFPALTLGAVCLLFLTGLFTRFALKLVARSVKPILQRLFLISRLTLFRLLVFIQIFVHFLYSFDENTSREGLYDFGLLKEQRCSIL
jgi:hypothetical protein